MGLWNEIFRRAENSFSLILPPSGSVIFNMTHFEGREMTFSNLILTESVPKLKISSSSTVGIDVLALLI